MTIIESVKEWVAEFPNLDDFIQGEIGVDLTDGDNGSYGLELTSDKADMVYIDGSEIRIASFYLYFRNATDFDVQRLENCGFCQNFLFWVNSKNRKEELPSLEPPLFADSISAQNGRILYYDDSLTSGVYQIQIDLKYLYLGD